MKSVACSSLHLARPGKRDPARLLRDKGVLRNAIRLDYEAFLRDAILLDDDALRRDAISRTTKVFCMTRGSWTAKYFCMTQPSASAQPTYRHSREGGNPATFVQERLKSVRVRFNAHEPKSIYASTSRSFA